MVVPFPDVALKVHGAIDAVDVGLDHVHSHAAAGKIGHFFRGGKSRQENEIEDFALAHVPSLLRGNHAALQIALLFTRAVSIPAPSSEISTSTWPPSWQARSFRCPSGRFPRATRCSGVSIP